MKYHRIIIAAVVLLASCTENKKGKEAESSKTAIVKYEMATVEKGGIATEIKLPAQLTAYQEVSIFPKVNGYVKNVLVDIGTKVAQGTLLMILQAPELEEATLQAKEKYAKVQADYSIDKEHYQRLLEASKTAGAISPLDLSTVKSRMDADLALCNAEKANWEMQQTMLEYLKVRAPFSGIITERNVSPGALVNAADKTKPMLELKQIEHLRLQVDVPESFSSILKNKDTVSFFVSAFPGKKMTGFISRKSMNVNPQYRSERIEIDVANKEGLLSSGMYADVTLYSSGNSNAFFIPKSAVVTSTERKYVLVTTEGKIKKVDVSTGNASSDKIEVFGALRVGEKVIEKANDELKEIL